MRFIKIVFPLFLLIAGFTVSGQKYLTHISARILQADTVEIISHEQTGGVRPPPLIIKGKLNQKIVREIIILTQPAKVALGKIIARPFQDTIYHHITCFVGHHAILIKKGSRLSYIDLCFECRHIDVSKDIKLENKDFDNRKWIELKAYFINHGIKMYMEEDGATDQ